MPGSSVSRGSEVTAGGRNGESHSPALWWGDSDAWMDLSRRPLVPSGNVTESLTVLPSGGEIVMPGWSSLGDPWSLQVM